jgi:phosphomannomutase
MSGDLFDTARAWLADDPDEDTRAELEALLVADEVEELADRFDGRLEFGTAGLRGALGAGPNRMNRAVVRRAAAGLAAYVRAHGGGAVVVGYDARHKSDDFAHDTAAVMEGAGVPAMVLPHPLPTPVLAFAIRHLGCAAGVMVTASHNPAQDNGYKVYLGDGSQIVPPADAEISAAIDAVGRVSELPLGEEWTTLGDEVTDAYLARVTGLLRPGGPRELSVVYTPLHGVGRALAVEAFHRAGFTDVHVVAEQADPDPDFPTVPFPNPEEPGAMDLALAAAAANGADLVIANDPDADRCAVAVPLPDGGYRMLRGDEVGVLLAVHLLDRGATGTFACSIVSSTLLGTIAADRGVRFAQTLTGFKWISRVEGLAFGYEEALGYCVDPAGVRDKDGISAALLVAELAAEHRAKGRTLLDVLDDVERRYGVHATDQLSVRVEDRSLITAAMDRLRSTPPSALGGRGVVAVDDLAQGVDGLPPTDGLRLQLEGGARVVVRPSGTEPKLKAYLEVVVPISASLAAARDAAATRIAAIKADLRSQLSG